MLIQLAKYKAQWETLSIEWIIQNTEPKQEDKVKELEHSVKVDDKLKIYTNRAQECFGHHEQISQ